MSGYKFKGETAETPGVNGIVNGFGKIQFRSSKNE